MKRGILYLFFAAILLTFSAQAQSQAVSQTEFANANNDKIVLGQNYPNPAVGKTYIDVDFDGMDATLTVYNVVGKLIETQTITSKLIVLDVSQYDEGIYLYTLECNGEKITRRMTVRKQ